MIDSAHEHARTHAFYALRDAYESRRRELYGALPTSLEVLSLIHARGMLHDRATLFDDCALLGLKLADDPAEARSSGVRSAI